MLYGKAGKSGTRSDVHVAFAARLALESLSLTQLYVAGGSMYGRRPEFSAQLIFRRVPLGDCLTFVIIVTTLSPKEAV